MSLLGSIFGVGKSILGKQTASKNVKAANAYRDATKWDPTGVSMPGSNISFDANGNAQGNVTDPTNQNMANTLYGAGQNFLGQSTAQGTQLPSYLTQAYNQSGQGMDQIAQGQGQAGQYLGGLMGQLPNQYYSNLGSLFQNQAQNTLGALGSFDPNQQAQQYTQQLRDAAAPGDRNATNDMFQSLFNSGRLGSTGGANQAQAMSDSQNQADLQRQIAGQQLGQQSQMNLSNMAQGLGNTGINMDLSALGANNQTLGTGGQLAGSLSNILSQAGQSANQRFTNAMGMFSGQQGQQGLNLQGALGTLGLGSNFGNQDTQNLLQMLGLSGQLSSAQGQQNLSAYAPKLQGKLASNNATGAAWGSGLNALQKGIETMWPITKV